MTDASKNATRHGHCPGAAESPTYRSWKALRRRCTDEKHKSFAFYGGRGVSFDPRWKSFEAFLSDMGECPPKHTLDRIDNSKNYSRENCRWATRTTQNRNRRGVVLTEESVKNIFRMACDGEPHASIAAAYGCSIQLVSNIKNGKAWADVTR